MMASRGMGAINPSKMPGAKKKARRDDTDFFSELGVVRNRLHKLFLLGGLGWHQTILPFVLPLVQQPSAALT